METLTVRCCECNGLIEVDLAEQTVTPIRSKSRSRITTERWGSLIGNNRIRLVTKPTVQMCILK